MAGFTARRMVSNILDCGDCEILTELLHVGHDSFRSVLDEAGAVGGSAGAVINIGHTLVQVLHNS